MKESGTTEISVMNARRTSIFRTTQAGPEVLRRGGALLVHARVYAKWSNVNEVIYLDNHEFVIIMLRSVVAYS